jgi:hypothetical protein
MSNITVIDAIMGTGKTNYAIKYMSEAPEDQRFIFITPFKKEIERIIESVKGRNIVTPNNSNTEGRKLRSLKDLILDGKDIAATHSLFKAADDELIELLNKSNYTLILDEVMDAIEPVNIKMGDITTLIDSKKINVDGNRVKWLDSGYDGDRFNDIKLYAEAENLFIYREKFILWAFPARIFDTFEKVFILTYLFRAQNMCYYFQLHKLPYTVKTLQDGELVDHDEKLERREDLYKLIDVYQGKMNDVTNKHALSASWLRRAKTNKKDAPLKQYKNNLKNYFTHIAKASSGEVMWATLSDVEHELKGKGYTNGKIAINARATNEFKERWALAYVYNRFKNPHETAFFDDNGISVNEELLAASDLLQWIWRSRIRDGQPVCLYLPSSRMRRILKEWANYEI